MMKHTVAFAAGLFLGSIVGAIVGVFCLAMGVGP